MSNIKEQIASAFELEKRRIAEAQRTDAHYAAVARRGCDSSTGENDIGRLQSYAARRSATTRLRLFELIDLNARWECTRDEV